jgi:hypothetical protein
VKYGSEDPAAFVVKWFIPFSVPGWVVIMRGNDGGMTPATSFTRPAGIAEIYDGRWCIIVQAPFTGIVNAGIGPPYLKDRGSDVNRAGP